MSLQFSGHDSFVCKSFWLKKGFDFIIKNERAFTDDFAVVDLGVGKNMVTAISNWLRAYGIVEGNNQPTEFGSRMFNDIDGYDPYLESIGSIWLLHYYLIKTNKASLYNLFFNDFRKGRFEFTKEQLSNYLLRKVESTGRGNISLSTINTDIAVFIRNYIEKETKSNKDVEDDFSNLMVDLQLLTSEAVKNADNKLVEWYHIPSDIRFDLPSEIVLFAILDNETYGNTISFEDLQKSFNSPGCVFALSEEGLYQKVHEISKSFSDYIVYKETAGVRELQFRNAVRPNKWQILHDYYSA